MLHGMDNVVINTDVPALTDPDHKFHSHYTGANPRPTQFLVMVRAAKMPTSCWGRYQRLGLVEVQPELIPGGARTPAMLSDRSRGMVRVLETREKCHHGGARSAAGRAYAELTAKCWALRVARMEDQKTPKASDARSYV